MISSSSFRLAACCQTMQRNRADRTERERSHLYPSVKSYDVGFTSSKVVR